jgi:hypothetical protein
MLRPQRFCFEGVRTPTHRSKSLTSREMVLILDFGFWAACASAHPNDTLYLLRRSGTLTRNPLT